MHIKLLVERKLLFILEFVNKNLCNRKVRDFAMAFDSDGPQEREVHWEKIFTLFIQNNYYCI